MTLMAGRRRRRRRCKLMGVIGLFWLEEVSIFSSLTLDGWFGCIEFDANLVANLVQTLDSVANHFVSVRCGQAEASSYADQTSHRIGGPCAGNATQEQLVDQTPGKGKGTS